MAGQEKELLPCPRSLAELSRAGGMLAVSSWFIISLPGWRRQSSALSGGGCEGEVAGPGQLPFQALPVKLALGEERAGREGPGPPFPCPPASAASAKLLQMGAGIPSSPPSSAPAATQRPLWEMPSPGMQWHMAQWHPRLAEGLI